MFERVSSVREFLARPGGRFITGKTWLVFHLEKSVAGLAFWGTPTPADIAPLLDVFRGFDSPLGARLPRYYDARRLVAAEQPVISQLLEFVKAERVHLDRLFSTIAFVHHGGVGQAITEGIRVLSHLPFEWADFRDPTEALEWLGCPRAAQVAIEVETLIESAAGDSMVVYDVRSFCAKHLDTASIQSAARALAMSTRSLQRKLASQGTSFQDLLHGVRVDHAKQLLRSTSQSVAEIAGAVGSTPRHFASIFRKLTGATPTEWRAAFVKG